MSGQVWVNTFLVVGAIVVLANLLALLLLGGVSMAEWVRERHARAAYTPLDALSDERGRP